MSVVPLINVEVVLVDLLTFTSILTEYREPLFRVLKGKILLFSVNEGPQIIVVSPSFRSSNPIENYLSKTIIVLFFKNFNV